MSVLARLLTNCTEGNIPIRQEDHDCVTCIAGELSALGRRLEEAFDKLDATTKEEEAS